MGQITVSTGAGDVVLRHPPAILVFERLGIPMGLMDKSLGEVAEEGGINPHLLLELLHVTLTHSPGIVDVLQPSDGLRIVDFLEQSHKFYSQTAYPRIVALIHEMRHGAGDKSFELVESFFKKYTDEVEEHFAYESQVAFPYVRGVLSGEQPQAGDYSVGVYKSRHEDIEDKLGDLESLLVKYLPMRESYAIRRELFLRIHELGDDLSAHTCIEDHILIPLVEREELRWN